MNAGILKKSNRGFINWLSVVAIILQCLTLKPRAEDNDQKIFNQLYQEIINSSTVGNQVKRDSMGSPGTSNSIDHKKRAVSENSTAPASEQLRKEIEKIVNDAKLRHSDAVKFMQDVK